MACPEARLHACLDAAQVRLLVETPCRGQWFQLIVRHSTTAEEVGEVLAEHCGVPATTFHLRFRTRRALGAAPFADAVDDEVVRMVLRSPLPGGAPSKRGYLTKEPVHGHVFSRRRRRFFVLNGSVLMWFEDEVSAGAPRGRMVLTGAHVVRSGPQLVVSTADERLVLLGDALDEWETCIRAAALSTAEQAAPPAGACAMWLRALFPCGPPWRHGPRA